MTFRIWTITMQMSGPLQLLAVTVVYLVKLAKCACDEETLFNDCLNPFLEDIGIGSLTSLQDFQSKSEDLASFNPVSSFKSDNVSLRCQNIRSHTLCIRDWFRQCAPEQIQAIQPLTESITLLCSDNNIAVLLKYGSCLNSSELATWNAQCTSSYQKQLTDTPNNAESVCRLFREFLGCIQYGTEGYCGVELAKLESDVLQQNMASHLQILGCTSTTAIAYSKADVLNFSTATAQILLTLTLVLTLTITLP